MITILLWGIASGIGLWAIAVWLFPPRPPLRDLVDRLNNAKPTAQPILQTTSSGWAAQAGQPFVRPLASLGLPARRVRADLAITGQTTDQFLAEKATLTIFGLLLPSVLAVFFVVLGMRLPWQIPTIVSVGCAIGGFLLSDHRVHHDARIRRTSFRFALSAYLNLIRVLLAGGAGVDGALSDAVAVGQGWAFQHLRNAIITARLTRTTPWTSLRQLGVELDIPQLAELAAAISLAGTEGARVRESLAAKATAIRVRELTDAEGEAQSDTERMSLPVVLLFGGFLLFIGYPAVAAVLGHL